MRTRSWQRLFACMLFASALLGAGTSHAIEVGAKAPAFSLPASVGKQAASKDFAGKTLVLFFYVGAFTNS